MRKLMNGLLTACGSKGKDRFKVDETAFIEDNFKISSKLLKLAKFINRINYNNQ